MNSKCSSGRMRLLSICPRLGCTRCCAKILAASSVAVSQWPFGSSAVVGSFGASERGVAEEARTRGFAAPVFTGCAFVVADVTAGGAYLTGRYTPRQELLELLHERGAGADDLGPPEETDQEIRRWMKGERLGSHCYQLQLRPRKLRLACYSRAATLRWGTGSVKVKSSLVAGDFSALRLHPATDSTVTVTIANRGA